MKSCSAHCISLFLLFLVFIFPSNISSEVVDRIIASIDGDPLTEEELREVIRTQFFTGRPQEVDVSKKLDEGLLKEAIITLLFEREAKRLNIRVTPDDISSYISQVERANNAGEGSLLAALEEQGISYDMYKKKVQGEMLRSRVLAAELRSKIQVSDEEIDEYIGRSDPEESDNSKKDAFSLIKVSFVNRLKNEEKGAEVELEKIREMLRETKSCSSISSLGGLCENLGQVQFADLKSDLQEVLKDKSYYDPSPVITQASEMVFFVKAPRTFSKEKSQVKEDVRQKLFQERFQEAAERYLKEDLFSKYHVEIHGL